MTGIGESSYRRDPETMTLNLENLVYTYSDALVRYATAMWVAQKWQKM